MVGEGYSRTMAAAFSREIVATYRERTSNFLIKPTQPPFYLMCHDIIAQLEEIGNF
jgi:hypothetical protein